MGDELRNKSEVRKLRATLEGIRADLHPELGVQTLAALLVVAENPGISVLEMGKKLNMTDAGASRNISLLAKIVKPGRMGLDLVRAEEDPYERRRKVLHLTPKGVRAVNQITDTLKGGKA